MFLFVIPVCPLLSLLENMLNISFTFSLNHKSALSSSGMHDSRIIYTNNYLNIATFGCG